MARVSSESTGERFGKLLPDARGSGGRRMDEGANWINLVQPLTNPLSLKTGDRVRKCQWRFPFRTLIENLSSSLSHKANSWRALPNAFKAALGNSSEEYLVFCWIFRPPRLSWWLQCRSIARGSVLQRKLRQILVRCSSYYNYLSMNHLPKHFFFGDIARRFFFLLLSPERNLAASITPGFSSY